MGDGCASGTKSRASFRSGMDSAVTWQSFFLNSGGEVPGDSELARPAL